MAYQMPFCEEAVLIYLTKRQMAALEMALEAMEYRNSGALDEVQAAAHDEICAMLRSARRELARRNTKKRIE